LILFDRFDFALLHADILLNFECFDSPLTDPSCATFLWHFESICLPFSFFPSLVLFSVPLVPALSRRRYSLHLSLAQIPISSAFLARQLNALFLASSADHAALPGLPARPGFPTPLFLALSPLFSAIISLHIPFHTPFQLPPAFEPGIFHLKVHLPDPLKVWLRVPLCCPMTANRAFSSPTDFALNCHLLMPADLSLIEPLSRLLAPFRMRTAASAAAACRDFLRIDFFTVVPPYSIFDPRCLLPVPDAFLCAAVFSLNSNPSLPAASVCHSSPVPPDPRFVPHRVSALFNFGLQLSSTAFFLAFDPVFPVSAIVPLRPEFAAALRGVAGALGHFCDQAIREALERGPPTAPFWQARLCSPPIAHGSGGDAGH
jgi:hypothetical protein